MWGLVTPRVVVQKVVLAAAAPAPHSKPARVRPRPQPKVPLDPPPVCSLQWSYLSPTLYLAEIQLGIKSKRAPTANAGASIHKSVDLVWSWHKP